MSPDACKRYLRYLELDAYAKMISVLRAQGPLTENKQKLLQELSTALHISNERHQAEVRRAVNDDKLKEVAERLFGPNSETEWTMEGRRTIPLISRLKGRNAYTTFANSIALTTAIANERQASQKKREVKYKATATSSQNNFEEKLLYCSDSENPFVSRKRKRSIEVSGTNDSIHSIPSLPGNLQILAKPLGSTKGIVIPHKFIKTNKV